MEADKEMKNEEEMSGAKLTPECERAGVLIEKELAGKLSPEESVELSRHVSACAECREYMKDAALLSGAFASFREEWDEVPMKAHRCSLSRASRSSERKLLSRVLPYVVSVAAGVVITIGILAAYGMLGSGEKQAVAVTAPPSEGAVGAVAEERLGTMFAAVEPSAVGVSPVTAGGRNERGTMRGHLGGLLIEKVMPGSWAEKAGIKPGDRLLEAAGIVLEPEGGQWALDYILRKAHSGNRIGLLLWRDDVGDMNVVYVVPDKL